LLGSVVLVLWQKSGVQARIDNSRLLLEQLVDHDFAEAGRGEFQWLIASYQLTCLQVVESSGTQHSFPVGCDKEDRLNRMLAETVQTSLRQTAFSGRSWAGVGPSPDFFHLTTPARVSGGAVGLTMSLMPVYEDVAKGRRVALAYLLINVVILTTIGFFRMVSLVIRPIDQLVQRADSLDDDMGYLFRSGGNHGEFGRLSLSLNQMLSRIDGDRRELEKTVESLRAANEELQKNRREMVRAEKLASVGRLSAGLAHEIGNPLGIVQGYLELLAKPDLDEKERREYSKRAVSELSRVNGLIRQLLDFSRKSTDTELKEVAVHPLLTEVVDVVRLKEKTSRINFQVDLGAEYDAVMADEDGLRQVFLNCLLNSVDALEEKGEGTPRIDVRSRNESGVDSGAVLVLEVKDNGPGVSAGHRDNVFDPFFTTKEPGKGTGLGLAVSYSIIEKIGGRIEMESPPGRGASVVITVPVVEGQSDRGSELIM
ncbi:MAG: ATP-binding protein, partial [Thermodesulfobacteriota bacterium]